MGTPESDRPRLAERRRAERIEAVRKDIIDAAIADFSDRGYHETSMAHIAERLGTGASTVYNYFKSKQEILECAVDDTLAALAQSLAASPAADSVTVEQFHTSANRLGDTIAEILVTDPNRARMLILIAGSPESELRARWTGFCLMATSFIEQYLDEGVASGHLRSDLNPAATARAIVAMPIGVVACDPALHLDREQAYALVRSSVALVINGIYRENTRTVDE